MTKDELSRIIDDFHFQMVVIKMCLESLYAIKEIGQDAINKRGAKNFFDIVHQSLVFRYEVELAKLFMTKGKEIKFSQITNLCCNNVEHFKSSDKDIRNLCGQISDVIKNHKKLNDNLVDRRHKALAHSDSNYYYYDKQYIEDYLLDENEITDEVEALFSFACILQQEIGSKGSHYHYPSQADDVKHLFNMKTKADIEDEKFDEWLKKNWNKE